MRTNKISEVYQESVPSDDSDDIIRAQGSLYAHGGGSGDFGFRDISKLQASLNINV